MKLHQAAFHTNSPSHGSNPSQFWRFLKFDRFSQVCSSIGNAFVNALDTKREPQCVWKRDRQGHSYLEVYDPTTEEHWYFRAEQDARIWLEQRYYIKRNSAIQESMTSLN